MGFEVKGEIIIPENKVISNCRINVNVLDTTFIDAPAKTIKEIFIDYSIDRYKIKVPFSIYIHEDMNKQNVFTLFVHVDVDNDGKISKYDMIHDRSYSIRSHNLSNHKMVIQLREV